MCHKLNPMVYVCVVSGYNLAELESCLVRRPSHVLLVVSDEEKFRLGAERLKKVIQKRFPEISLHQPVCPSGDFKLGGDDVLECQAWVQGVLLPYLNQAPLQGLPHCLNFTGGTKAMTAALLSIGQWTELDYKAISKQVLQVLTLQERQSKAPEFAPLKTLSIEDATALEVAALYNPKIKNEALNPLVSNSCSGELAQSIWNAQASQDPSLQHLFDALSRVWSEGREDVQHKNARTRVNLPENLDWAAFDAWLQRCNALVPGALSREQATLLLPGNKCKDELLDFKHWISGDWLEQLCYDWLHQAGVLESGIVRNLVGGQDDSRTSSKREADLLLHHRGTSRVIEVKAGLPKDFEPKHMQEQLSSLEDRFGKTKKVLFIGPALKFQLGTKWEDFYIRCKAAEVEVGFDRASLLKYAGLH